MRSDRSNVEEPKGFTLIELLVVVAIIALLISILLPSLSTAKKQAQAAACSANLYQVMVALRMYQDDHKGSLPNSHIPDSAWVDGDAGSLWSEAAHLVRKKNLWFYRLVPRYLGNPNALICPGDPFRTEFDFDATPEGGEPHTDVTVASCGYGMNFFLRHYAFPHKSYLMNTDRYAPRYPDKTILLADVGPDDQLVLEHLDACLDPGGVGQPWRDGGRIIWDDGVRGWYQGPTWLTMRHLGKINMTTMDGAVHAVPTAKQLREGPKARDDMCLSMVWPMSANNYLCHLCYDQEPHYVFAEQGLWWWTGPVPPP